MNDDIEELQAVIELWKEQNNNAQLASVFDCLLNCIKHTRHYS